MHAPCAQLAIICQLSAAAATSAARWNDTPARRPAHLDLCTLNASVLFLPIELTCLAMAAGIVASTLRRKAFHRRLLDGGNRYQTVSAEPGHIPASPTDETSSTACHAGWTSFSSSHGAAGSGGGAASAGGRRSFSSSVDASAVGGSDARSTATPADSDVGSSMFPRGAQLCRVDFWPKCINPTEANMRRVEFETFEYVCKIEYGWVYVYLNGWRIW